MRAAGCACRRRAGQHHDRSDGNGKAYTPDDAAGSAQVRRLVQREDADREAAQRRHGTDDRKGDQRRVGLIGGLCQGERCQAADDQCVKRPGGEHRAQPVRGGVRERHRQHGDTGVGHAHRDGEQQSPGTTSGGQQTGGGEREGEQAGDERGRRGVCRAVAAGVLVRAERCDADADRGHEREDRRPAAARQRPPGEQAAQREADQQRAAEDHLHHQQRTGAQGRGVQDETAGLQHRADQPDRLPGEPGEQPRPAGGLARRARGLPVFDRDPRSVQHGGQRGQQ